MEVLRVVENKKKWVPLHNHDEYSVLDGFGKSIDYARVAKEKGFEYLGMTNHGNVDGAIKFQEACNEAGIIPIHGCELYIVEDLSIKEKGEKRKHITIIIKDQIGWKNLLKMLTVANLEGFYYRPRIDPKLLLAHCEGLIVLTACASSFVTEQWGENLLELLRDKIPGDVYLEIMPHEYPEQEKLNSEIQKLSGRLSVQIVASNDCHYPDSGDEIVQEVLLAIQSKKKWRDPARWKFDVTGLHLKTYDEMVDAFDKQDILPPKTYKRALRRTAEIAEKCKNFAIEQVPVELPRIPGYEDIPEDVLIRDLCEKSLERRGKTKGKKYTERLEEELGIIIKQKFCLYFLIVWELVKWCKENDIMVGPGRGSAGSSLVCYLLGITTVDPIKFDLLFARFISPARIDLPDIDMDFEDIKRPLIRQHLEDLYGKNKIAGVKTFSRLKGKGAIRDVSRVFDVPLADVNAACDSIVVRSGGDFRSDFTIEDAFQTFEDGKKFRKKYPRVTDYAMKLEGQIRNTGQHAAAMIVSLNDLWQGDHCNLARGKDGIPIVNWEKTDIEYMGLMKLDVLGLNALTVLNFARKLIKENHNFDVIYEEIPLDDERVFEEFSKGNNIGVFQFGSLGLRKFCRELGIEDFEMLTHANALYRPGTLRSGMTTDFQKRKFGEEKIEHVHPIIEELTKDTYGIILYQEQVMKFMYDLGGLGWRTADTVRKVISKSKGVEQFNKFKEIFADGCVKRKTLDRETALRLWDELSSFGSYGFNKSHAVEYTMIGYWDMWLKVHYPEEFICASLTYGTKDEAKKTDLIEEALRIGLDVRPPKYGISHHEKWLIKEKVLYAPFIEIKGFGVKTAKKAGEYKVKNKDNFFEKDDEKLTKFEKILRAIRAFDDTELSDEEYGEMADYFSVSFVRDPAKKLRKIITILKDNLKVVDLKNSQKSQKEKYFFGYMTEIKFGYKEAVNKTDSSSRESMGGVYGNLKDNTDFSMVVFSPEIYQRKKNKVEHCAEQFSLISARPYSNKTALRCSDAWFEDELLSGDLAELNLQLAEKRRYNDPSVVDCEICSLHQECTRPVPASKGIYNIMIIGEAPGRDEDRDGEGFVGKSGALLWAELRRYSLRRKQFNITNVVKCYPRDTKTPSKNQIKKCAKTWLQKEIEKIKPFLILSMGNTGLKYFKDQDSGIMAKNGTAEWDEKIGAWICWCIHPASVLYSPENRILFRKGVKNFEEKVKNLGGI